MTRALCDGSGTLGVVSALRAYASSGGLEEVARAPCPGCAACKDLAPDARGKVSPEYEGCWIRRSKPTSTDERVFDPPCNSYATLLEHDDKCRPCFRTRERMLLEALEALLSFEIRSDAPGSAAKLAGARKTYDQIKQVRHP